MEKVPQVEVGRFPVAFAPVVLVGCALLAGCGRTPLDLLGTLGGQAPAADVAPEFKEPASDGQSVDAASDSNGAERSTRSPDSIASPDLDASWSVDVAGLSTFDDLARHDTLSFDTGASRDAVSVFPDSDSREDATSLTPNQCAEDFLRVWLLRSRELAPREASPPPGRPAPCYSCLAYIPASQCQVPPPSCGPKRACVERHCLECTPGAAQCGPSGIATDFCSCGDGCYPTADDVCRDALLAYYRCAARYCERACRS